MPLFAMLDKGQIRYSRQPGRIRTLLQGGIMDMFNQDEAQPGRHRTSWRECVCPLAWDHLSIYEDECLDFISQIAGVVSQPQTRRR